MTKLPDDLLLHSYEQAKELQLDAVFIQLLKQEIENRSLSTIPDCR